MRAVTVLVIAIVASTFAGCLEATPAAKNDLKQPDLPVLGDVLNVTLANAMTFTEHIVKAAVGFTSDLYEPTMEVSKTGVIYVTGHTILVDTTGAPVFMSKDDGKTWSQLPFLASAKMPEPVHGATPPPSDEIFLVAGDDGWLYGVDITAATFPVNAWKGNGAEHAYHDPNAYDRASSTASQCGAVGLNDRPWASYAKGKLLMVNNPGGGQAPLGRVEVGVMDVPPTVPVGVGNPAIGPKWNYCATVGGSIPGVPGMRDDHFFGVPQVKGGVLNVVTGNAKDVMAVKVVKVFENTNAGGGTSNGGRVTFDKDGTMFVGIRNNTGRSVPGNPTITGQPTTRIQAVNGQLHFAVSRDNGTTFQERTIKLDGVATALYLDGNMMGPGALAMWAQLNGTNRADWFTGHLFVGPDGKPVLENATRVISNGPPTSAHVQGAAAGPDGRAYFVTFHGGYAPADRATPLHVWTQQSGPTLPVAAALPAVAMK